jgi:hypothetical protein
MKNLEIGTDLGQKLFFEGSRRKTMMGDSGLSG